MDNITKAIKILQTIDWVGSEAKARIEAVIGLLLKEPQGCEYCKQIITTVKMDFETDSILGENKWFSSTRRPKYCPMCGRRLEPKEAE